MSTISVRESISKVIENPWRFVNLLSLAIFFRLRQRPLSIKDIISKCDEPGIVHRTAFLEIDMMQGTAFPPDQLLFEGRLHTLQDIYLQAGIILDVRLDENNILDLSGPDGTYTDAELDSLAQAHRNPNFQESGNVPAISDSEVRIVVGGGKIAGFVNRTHCSTSSSGNGNRSRG